MLTKPDLNKPVFAINPQAAEAVKACRCPTCGIEILEAEFKDAASRREYSISGMCQHCQDEVFGCEEE